MRQYEIKKATKEDLWEILDLQYIAYQSEADLFGTQDIPPLKQTIDEVIRNAERRFVCNSRQSK